MIKPGNPRLGGQLETVETLRESTQDRMLGAAEISEDAGMEDRTIDFSTEPVQINRDQRTFQLVPHQHATITHTHTYPTA